MPHHQTPDTVIPTKTHTSPPTTHQTATSQVLCTHVRTFSGWVYVAFITDVYSRRIIGWQTTCRPVCTDLALDALEMAVWQRKRQRG